jgi:hypothetical protein
MTTQQQELAVQPKPTVAEIEPLVLQFVANGKTHLNIKLGSISATVGLGCTASSCC